MVTTRCEGVGLMLDTLKSTVSLLIIPFWKYYALLNWCLVLLFDCYRNLIRRVAVCFVMFVRYRMRYHDSVMYDSMMAHANLAAHGTTDGGVPGVDWQVKVRLCLG